MQWFVRKFRRAADQEHFHTYRDLILGSHLKSVGWDLRYEQRVRGKTPHWTVYNADGNAAEILDVVTLHQRRVVDVKITRAASLRAMTAR